MTADLLSFPDPTNDAPAIVADDDLAACLQPLSPEGEPEIEPDAEPAIESEASEALVAAPLIDVLPADFRLPLLTKFIPNPALRVAADDAATYALTVQVDGAEGLQRADLAATALRTSLQAITDHFEEPASIANALHKRITALRAEWQEAGKAALATVGQRIYAEQKRIEALAAEERRKAQAEADRLVREAAQREAAAAAKAKAPAAVVEELKRQAETATAPPVAAMSAPVLRGTSTVERWKGRLLGTPADEAPNPEMAKLSAGQRMKVFDLMHAVLDGKAPLILFDLNWPEINRRANAEKSAFAVPGLEAFDAGGTRAKSSRSR